MAESTITVEATGHVETAPESVQLTIEATAISDTTNTAREEAFEKAVRIRERINESSVDIYHLEAEKSILTDPADTYTSSIEEGQYKAMEQLSARCSPDEASTLVDVISEIDGTVPTAKFSVPDEKRRELTTQAVSNAMTEARAIAESIAHSENLNIVGVSHVRRPPANEDEDLLESLEHAPGFNFHPHTIPIAERVTVTYDVESSSSAG